ncbi:MAG: DNA topoisomerase (ATP-hydrolyzing) subunit B [Thermosulfidibacteraceae bacterium]
MTNSKENNYTADKIKILAGLEAVRKRPSMYIGDTGHRGLHHLVFEIVDNSVDEHVAGYCKNIEVVIHHDNSVTVIDDGRGIPVDIHPEAGKSALEVVMTTLHAGGKFDSGAYKISGGLHGVGVSVVNALSEYLEVEVRRDGKVYYQKYERGVPVTSVVEKGTTKKTGTKVTFKPDKGIFGKINFDFDYITARLRELAFLNPGLRITVRDERTYKEEVFCYDGGIVELVRYLNEGKTPLYPQIFYMKKESDGVIVEIAFQHNAGFQETLYSFANNIRTIDGGTHVSGFRSALTRVVNNYATKNELLKGFKGQLTGEDFREGLTAVIHVKVPNPQFEGQTKTKLGNSEVKSAVESLFSVELQEFLERHPDVAKVIIEKALNAAQAREASKKAKELVRKRFKFEISTLPGKLADCSERDPRKRELFIVEGESAGGSAKQGRDRTFQAVLSLKGKILNVEKAREDKMLSNQEIRNIILAVGAGIDEDFDLSKVRYHRIIIMTDADIDGAHIRTLLLTFFFRRMKPLIEAGYVYIAQPPLYKVKKGKKELYIEDDEALRKFFFSEGLKEVKVYIDSREISTEKVREICEKVKEVEFLECSYKAKGRDITVLRALKEFDGREKILTGDEAVVNRFIKFLEERGIKVKDYRLTDEGDNFKLTVISDCGLTEIGEAILTSKRYERLCLLWDELDSYSKKKIKIKVGKDERIVSVWDLYSVIMEVGKSNTEIQRYKGLGEMNPEQLWETTMNPETRKLKKVTLADAEEADRLFSILMGEEVEPRKEFITRHAKEVRNLDI